MAPRDIPMTPQCSPGVLSQAFSYPFIVTAGNSLAVGLERGVSAERALHGFLNGSLTGLVLLVVKGQDSITTRAHGVSAWPRVPLPITAGCLGGGEKIDHRGDRGSGPEQHWAGGAGWETPVPDVAHGEPRAGEDRAGCRDQRQLLNQLR